MIGGGSGMMGGGGFWGGSGFGLIGMILNLVITLSVIIGILWLVVWITRRVTSGGQDSSLEFGYPQGKSSPRELLESRYVRGEITRDEFQQILADLS